MSDVIREEGMERQKDESNYEVKQLAAKIILLNDC